MGEIDTHSTHRGEHPQRSNTQGLLSQWVCSTPTFLNHRSESQRRNRSGWALVHPPGSRPHHRQGSDSHRAKGKLASISRAGSGHSNNSQSPDQEIRAQTSGPTSPTRGQTPGARGTRILQPAERRPQTQNMRQNERTKKYVVEEGARQKPA